MSRAACRKVTRASCQGPRKDLRTPRELGTLRRTPAFSALLHPPSRRAACDHEPWGPRPSSRSISSAVRCWSASCAAMMRSASSPTSASSAVSSSDTSSGSSSLRGSVIVGHRVLGSQLLLLAPPTRAWPQAPLGACPQYLQPALVTNAAAEVWLNSRRLGSGGVWCDNGRKRLVEQARDRQ